MTRRRRDRGRPALFTPTLITQYLTARATGATQQEAAAAVGVAVRTVRDAYIRVRGFRDAEKHAADLGRQARIDELPHDESRYTNLGCRCGICRKAATAARIARRQHAAQEAPVVPLPPPPGPHQPPPPQPADQATPPGAQGFPLARAS